MSRQWGGAAFRARYEAAQPQRTRRRKLNERTIALIVHLADRYSLRAIARRVGVSHVTVAAVLGRERGA